MNDNRQGLQHVRYGHSIKESILLKYLKYAISLVPVAAVCVSLSTSLLAGKSVAAQDTSAKKSSQSKPPANPSTDPAGTPTTPSGYRVGVEDELGISVWHEPELSQQVVVRPDGMITLPLVNDIKVAGLTMDELQALLVEKLKTVVNDPQVTVTVKAVRSRKVFLVGNVAKQGAYPLAGHMTVLELIAEAGGLGPFAKSNSIYVLRKENGKEVHLPFSYKKALSGKGANPELLPGDMVVVP